jgi:hypothetical protein
VATVTAIACASATCVRRTITIDVDRKLDQRLGALARWRGVSEQDLLAALLGTLAEAAAGGGPTVVLSSHLIADIERVCDHLILLSESRVQPCGDIETLLAEHRILTGPRKDTTGIAQTHAIVREDTTTRQTTLLVRLNGPVIDRDYGPIAVRHRLGGTPACLTKCRMRHPCDSGREITSRSVRPYSCVGSQVA